MNGALSSVAKTSIRHDTSTKSSATLSATLTEAQKDARAKAEQAAAAARRQKRMGYWANKKEQTRAMKSWERKIAERAEAKAKAEAEAKAEAKAKAKVEAKAKAETEADAKARAKSASVTEPLIVETAPAPASSPDFETDHVPKHNAAAKRIASNVAAKAKQKTTIATKGINRRKKRMDYWSSRFLTRESERVRT